VNISVFFSGEFGRRFLLNLAYPEMCPKLGACGLEACDYCKDYDFSSKIVMVEEFADPASYGVYIDEPLSILPEILDGDVFIAINLHPDILVELPSILEPYKALVIPVEDPKWCSPGLRNQIARHCEEVGIEFACPKPICTLKPETKFISKFCEEFKFGRPRFEVKVDDSTILNAKALTDTCGCAYYVSKKMTGYWIDNKEDFWKEIHQHQCAYPCLASMERDVEIKESPFHLGGYTMVYYFSQAVGIDALDFVPDHMRKILGLRD
jgi:hypothetical protein